MMSVKNALSISDDDIEVPAKHEKRSNVKQLNIEKFLADLRTNETRLNQTKKDLQDKRLELLEQESLAILQPESRNQNVTELATTQILSLPVKSNQVVNSRDLKFANIDTRLGRGDDSRATQKINNRRQLFAKDVVDTSQDEIVFNGKTAIASEEVKQAEIVEETSVGMPISIGYNQLLDKHQSERRAFPSSFK